MKDFTFGVSSSHGVPEDLMYEILVFMCLCVLLIGELLKIGLQAYLEIVAGIEGGLLIRGSEVSAAPQHRAGETGTTGQYSGILRD